MKRLIAVVLTLSALLPGLAMAQALTVNGETVEDIEVTGIGFTPGDQWELSVTTAGGESLVVAGGDPAPEPDPEPVEPEPVEPQPEPPAAGVIRRYHIRDFDNATAGVSFVIPRGATIASRFTTTEEVGKQGGIYFQSLGAVRPRTDAWISKVAGGEVLHDSRYCRADAANFTFSVLWKQESGLSWYCLLEAETSYYINVKHSDSQQPATTVTRKVY